MDVEKASKLLERLQRDIGLFKKRAMQVGENNPNDSAAFREKIGQLRTSIQKTENDLQTMMQNAPSPGTDRAWDQIRSGQRDTKRDFDQADQAERRREKMFPIGRSGEAAAASTGGNGGRAAAGGQIDLSQLQRVDMSELATEEAIQYEKAKAAREIEQEAGELHGAYVEFNSLTKEQQKGLDQITTNVTKAHTSVERGVTELQQASTHQKSSRKKLCILLLIVTVVIAIVVVVVVVLKK